MKNNKEPFNFTQFFAQSYADLTRDKLSKAAIAAGGWTTCACGNLCKDIPRSDIGVPLDSALRQLGIDFSDCFDAAEEWWDENINEVHEQLDIAEDILCEIEARSKELLGEHYAAPEE